MTHTDEKRTGETTATSQIIARQLFDLVTTDQSIEFELPSNLVSDEISLFAKRLLLWRGAMTLMILNKKAKEDPSLKPIFAAFYDALIGDDSEAETELVVAIKHIAVLAHSDASVAFLESIKSSGNPFSLVINIQKYLVSTFRKVELLLDQTFGKVQDATLENYDEIAYLAANADVAKEVAAGCYVSGFQHFASCGHGEGRKLKFAATAPMLQLD